MTVSFFTLIFGSLKKLKNWAKYWKLKTQLNKNDRPAITKMSGFRGFILGHYNLHRGI